MADFLTAAAVLATWEGGYSCDPRDPGGETYCGISRKNWPNWDGWAFIDSAKSRTSTGSLPWNWKSNDNSIVASVNQFYFTNFWDKQSFVLLDSQDVANKIFQHYVNMGDHAIKLAQAVVFPVTTNDIDGMLGPHSAECINFEPPSSYLPQYVQQLENYYTELIAQHPHLSVYKDEWMLRAKTIGPRP